MRWKMPLRGKVQRRDFPTPLGNPAEYDVKEIKKAVWVIRDHSSYSQATAFYLKNIGFVTLELLVKVNTSCGRP